MFFNFNKIANNSKSILIIGAIVVFLIILTSYYLFIGFSQKDLTAKIDNCRIVGEQHRKQEKIDAPELDFLNPKYGYSKSLGTCVYSGGFQNYIDGEYSVYKNVIDLNTNKQIIFSAYIGDEKMFGLRTEEYSSEEEKIFAE